MKIVGAGVVGLYLGLLLKDVTILERNPELREKSCGGLVSTRITQLVDIKDCVLNEIKGARIFWGNTELLVERNKTQAYVIDRFLFQKNLFEMAESNGARIIFGTPWKKEKEDIIIGADGAYSSVARFLGIKRRYIYTIEGKGTLNTESEYVQVHLGSFAPGFFAWVIPEDEKTVRIGLGATKGNLLEHFNIFIKHLGAELVGNPRKWAIPVYDGKKATYEKNGTIFALVGDAAAQVKATSGGGIIFGLLCAKELARAINEGNIKAYETYWRSKYGKILRNHLIIRNIINRMNEPCFRALKSLGIKWFLEQFGDMDMVIK